jgi:hypothetical protein
MVDGPAHEPAPWLSTKVTVTLEQASVAVALPRSGTPPQAKVVLAGTKVKVGAPVSAALVTVCTAVAVLPQPSVAVKVRVVTTPAHTEPVVTSLDVTVTDEQASVAVAVPNTAVALQAIIVLAGTKVKVGACVSTSLTVRMAMVELLQASEVVHTLTVVLVH